MKKITSLLLTTLITLNTYAQKTERGIWQIEIGTGVNANYNWITGGDWKSDLQPFSGSTISNDGDWTDIYSSQSNLNYDLDFTNFSDWESRFLNGISFGYFIADNFLIGLGLDLNGLNARNNYNDDPYNEEKVKWDQFNLGAIPKLRYYMHTGRGNALFFEGSFGMGISNNKAFIEGTLAPGTSDAWDNYLNPDPATINDPVGTGVIIPSDDKDTWESKRNIFTTSIGLAVGYSAFLFNSREIFSIEPMIGFNINSRKRVSETSIYDESADESQVLTIEDKIADMGPYFKLKLAFYLGRHFWSH